jgi:hypothetical protein
LIFHDVKKIWRPTWSSCFWVIFHNKEILSLNIYVVILNNPTYLWNCKQISTTIIQRQQECNHNLLKVTHKMSNHHHFHHEYHWWIAMIIHCGNHNYHGKWRHKNCYTHWEVVLATPKNVWKTSTTPLSWWDNPSFLESCPHKQ